MPRRKEQNDDPTSERKARNNATLRIAVSAVGFAIVVALLFSMKKTSTDMLLHLQDRPNAIGKIVKECGEAAQQKGLKNVEAMKDSDECSKQKIAELDGKH